MIIRTLEGENHVIIRDKLKKEPIPSVLDFDLDIRDLYIPDSSSTLPIKSVFSSRSY